MRRAVIAGMAVAVLVAAPMAAGAVPLGARGTVAPDGRAMTWRVSYRLPTDPAAPVRMRWVAYGGAREDRRLRRRTAGEVTLTPKGGVITFTRRVPVPTAGPISGGFCADLDVPVPGMTAAPRSCPTRPTATRDQLPARVPEVTLIGDSVATGLDYVPGGRATATGRWSAIVDVKVCRRLIAPPCPPNPPSALSVIRSLAGALGDVVLIHVGYNDWGAVYDIGQVMKALKARGVRRVVWVNLQSIAPASPGVNAAIHRAAGRYPWLQLADWNAHSAGHGWFVGDRDHLTTSGAYALASFYRVEIARAIRALRDPPAPRAT